MKRTGTIWIILLCASAALAAGAFFIGKGNSPSAQDGQQMASTDGALAHHSADDRAQFQWTMNCQGCHGPNGEGSPQRDVPPLVDIAAFQGVAIGREFLVRVPGVSRSPLNDDDLAKLLNWMIRTKTEGLTKDNFTEFTEEEVRNLRTRPLGTNIKEVRSKLINQIN